MAPHHTFCKMWHRIIHFAVWLPRNLFFRNGVRVYPWLHAHARDLHETSVLLWIALFVYMTPSPMPSSREQWWVNGDEEGIENPGFIALLEEQDVVFPCLCMNWRLKNSGKHWLQMLPSWHPNTHNQGFWMTFWWVFYIKGKDVKAATSSSNNKDSFSLVIQSHGRQLCLNLQLWHG